MLFSWVAKTIPPETMLSCPANNDVLEYNEKLELEIPIPSPAILAFSGVDGTTSKELYWAYKQNVNNCKKKKIFKLINLFINYGLFSQRLEKTFFSFLQDQN